MAYGTEDENRQPADYREVICIFHNLKGYDSIFPQHRLVQEERHVFGLGPVIVPGVTGYTTVVTTIHVYHWKFTFAERN